MIAGLIERAESAERRAHELAQDLEKADALWWYDSCVLAADEHAAMDEYVQDGEGLAKARDRIAAEVRERFIARHRDRRALAVGRTEGEA